MGWQVGFVPRHGHLGSSLAHPVSMDYNTRASDNAKLARSRGRGRMSKLQGIAGPIICAVLCLNVTVAQAGPCSEDIAQFEAAIRQSAGNPNAGLTAPQSIGAQLNRQPTPDSLKQAQERLQSKFSATMARAKRLDAKGDLAGCTRALAKAKRMYIL